MTNNFNKRNFIISILILITIRILLMVFIPLTENTEARYGEIARKMVETNDWITPQIEYGVPFWAKPPLSTWLSAGSMKIFGVNEFATRLPAFIISIIVILLMLNFAKGYIKKPFDYLFVTILSSMALFYLVAGTVMTDASLMLACILIQVSFWKMMQEKSGYKWGMLLFFSLGLGMLAKGPVSWVLSGLPIFFWLFWAKKWSEMFKKTPWVFGGALMLVTSLPWYIMAEIKTPGFIKYFIVGENFQRFIDPSWSGDLYGYAHVNVLGTIWLYLLLAGIPWSFVAIYYLITKKFKGKNILLNNEKLNEQDKYLICWLLIPMLFFTFSRNILITYAITVMPALALLITKFTGSIFVNNGKIKISAYITALFIPIILMFGLIFSWIMPTQFAKYTEIPTAKYVSKLFHEIDSTDDQKLMYTGGKFYSMEFYNGGKALRFKNVEEAINYSKNNKERFLALRKEQSNRLNEKTKDKLKLISEVYPYELYEVKNNAK